MTKSSIVLVSTPFEQLRQAVYWNPSSFVFKIDKAKSGVVSMDTSLEPVNGSVQP